MLPEIYCYYRHKYGGVYVIKGISESTTDKTQWVVYNHVWPFEEKQFHQPIEGWTEERFRKLNGSELVSLLGRERSSFQNEIIANKVTSKDK